MFRNKGKGWLLAVVVAVGLGWPATAQDAAVQLEPQAQTTQVVAPAANGTERIELTFSEPEQDLLTRAAIEKLEAPIESLEFSNADLRNVIRIIGERLNINFIFDSGEITGNVTLRLRNVRLRDALDSVLKTRGLAIVVDPSGIFRIVPQTRISSRLVETRTEVIQLNWIRAEDVQLTMQPFLSSEDHGRLVANQESNSIIITDVPPQIEIIRDLIHKIDIPERQVQIEARLVDINIDALQSFGTEWTLSQANTGGQVGAPGYDPLRVANVLYEGLGFDQYGAALALGDQIGIFGGEYNLNAAFNFLENRNIVEILANPRVTTLNNVSANIDIIERIPYRSATQLVAGGSTSEQIEFADAGIKITVRPIITPNGFVRMTVELEQAINRGRVNAADPLSPPRMDERAAGTNVIVQTGSTVVLGGLRQTNNINGITGVPWLHRVPVLGWLFKNKTNTQSRTELVLMMTPTIIEERPEMSKWETHLHGKLEREWNKPDYFMDDVSTTDDLIQRDSEVSQ